LKLLEDLKLLKPIPKIDKTSNPANAITVKAMPGNFHQISTPCPIKANNGITIESKLLSLLIIKNLLSIFNFYQD
jgi:hypothetical protein